MGGMDRTFLKDMSGTGEYVFAIATVTETWGLPTNKPYQKGYLTDPKKPREQKRYFVVYDPDLRLEKEVCYKMVGRDYDYEKRQEIQLVLGEDPWIEPLSDQD